MSKVSHILNPALLPKECWRPTYLENQRNSDRMKEREIERISVWIQFKSSQVWQKVRLRDYSLDGIGVYYEHGLNQKFQVSVQDRVSLKFSISLNQESIIPCRVQNLGESSNGNRLGLQRLDIVTGFQGTNFDFPNKFYLNQNQATITRILNPFLYDEWAKAAFIGIGPRNTLLFNTTDHALLLLSGQSLSISMELASSGGGIFEGVILWSIKQEDGSLHFTVTPKNMSFEINNSFIEFIIHEWGLKPEVLKSYGFQIRRFKNQLAFIFVSTQEEYSQVLMLRRNAYVQAGKCELSTSPEQMTSLHDPQSRILAVYHNKEMVASMTMNFGQNGLTNFRSEELFPANKYPVAVPPKDSMIEVYSACTHKDYRGGDLFHGLIEQASRTLLLSNRDWIITLVTNKLWIFYQRMGFKKIGASVRIQQLNNIEHHLILIHRNAVLYGSGMNIMDWNYFYGDLMNDIIKNRMLIIPPWKKICAISLIWLTAFTSKWISRKREMDFKKHLRDLNEKESIDA